MNKEQKQNSLSKLSLHRKAIAVLGMFSVGMLASWIQASEKADDIAFFETTFAPSWWNPVSSVIQTRRTSPKEDCMWTAGKAF